jgi:hypothetical protein
MRMVVVARWWRRGGDDGVGGVFRRRSTVVARVHLPAVSFHHLHAARYKIVNPHVVAPAETETKGCNTARLIEIVLYSIYTIIQALTVVFETLTHGAAVGPYGNGHLRRWTCDRRSHAGKPSPAQMHAP